MGSDRFWRGFTWALFFAAMAVVAYLVRNAWDAWGWWFWVPGMIAIFGVCVYLDRRAGRY